MAGPHSPHMFFWKSSWNREAVLCRIKFCALLFATCRQQQVAGGGGVRNWFSVYFLLHQIFTKALWFHALAAFLLSSHRGWKNTHKNYWWLSTSLQSLSFSYCVPLLIHLCLLPTHFSVNHWPCSQVMKLWFYISLLWLKTPADVPNCCRDLFSCPMENGVYDF